jgi:hypothetical protein
MARPVDWVTESLGILLGLMVFGIGYFGYWIAAGYNQLPVGYPFPIPVFDVVDGLLLSAAVGLLVGFRVAVERMKAS